MGFWISASGTIFDLRWNADIGVIDSSNCMLTPTVDSKTEKYISCFLRKDNTNDLEQSEMFVWSWYEIWKQNSTLVVLMNQGLYTSSSLRRQGKLNMWPSRNSFACVTKRSYHCLQRLPLILLFSAYEELIFKFSYGIRATINK